MAGRLDDIKNFRRVSPGLATSGQPSEAQLAAAAAAGFEAVINLALHDDPRYALVDEAGTVAGLGMDYIHIPVQFSQPTRDDFTAFCDAMRRCQGRTTLVHCAANYRVTAFLGLYWETQEHWPHDKAFALMESVWTPDDVWAAFIAARLAEGPALKPADLDI